MTRSPLIGPSSPPEPDAEPHLHEDVAVALLVDQPLQADRAAGALEVEHLDVVGELLVLEHLGPRPGGRVIAAAG
jgi:hypothetical protein